MKNITFFIFLFFKELGFIESNSFFNFSQQALQFMIIIRKSINNCIRIIDVAFIKILILIRDINFILFLQLLSFVFTISFGTTISDSIGCISIFIFIYSFYLIDVFFLKIISIKYIDSLLWT